MVSCEIFIFTQAMFMGFSSFLTLVKEKKKVIDCSKVGQQGAQRSAGNEQHKQARKCILIQSSPRPNRKE